MNYLLAFYKGVAPTGSAKESGQSPKDSGSPHDSVAFYTRGASRGSPEKSPEESGLSPEGSLNYRKT